MNTLNFNTQSSNELLSYFTKLSDILKYAESHDIASVVLGPKDVSVLDLKKSMFNLLHNLKSEIFYHHRSVNSQYNEDEIKFIESLAKYDQHTSMYNDYTINKYSSGVMQVIQGIASLLFLGGYRGGKIVEDAALFTTGRILDINSSPFDKLKADLEMLHAAENYADYIKATRIEEECCTATSNFIVELGIEHSIQDLSQPIYE